MGAGHHLTGGRQMNRTAMTGAAVAAVGALILVTPFRPKDWASPRYPWDPHAHECDRRRTKP